MYLRSNDGRISAVYNDQYSSTLAILEETADKAFQVYMTCKIQGWFQRWVCPRPSDATASPGPGAAPGGVGSGAGAATPARPPAPSASDDEEASDLIAAGQVTSPTVNLKTFPPAGRA